MANTTDITRSTTRIKNTKANRDVSTGTGFFWRFSDVHMDFWVVTNRHVVAGHKDLALNLDIPPQAPPNANVKFVNITVTNPTVIEHPNPEIDLAAIWLPPYIGAINKQVGEEPQVGFLGRPSIATPSFMDDLSPVEPVLMVGYPNGLLDEANNKPIVRKGITASAAYIDYNGKPEFLIDCACYPGSSGSPVYIRRDNPWVSRKTGSINMGNPPMALVGVLYSGPTISQQGKITQPNSNGPSSTFNMNGMMNLGNCIRATEIEAMAPLAQAVLKNKVTHP